MKVLPFRLLPATIVALAALLGAKSIELVWAAVPVRTPQPISAASPATTIPPENVQPNLASDIERGLLQELQRRRTQLDQRESAVEQREATLVAAEEKLNQRIHELQHLQQQLKATLVERKQRTDAAWISLVTLYEAMKPRDAAAILNDLDMPVLVELTARMNERKAAAIMAAMQPDRARDLTAKLAEYVTAGPSHDHIKERSMTVDNSMNALIIDDYKTTVLTQEPAPNLATQLQDVTLRIHKACSFQDMARQRISKVVNALNTIEQKVLTTLATFGPRSRNPTNLTKPHGEGLLNGPQLL